jgi:hypothetical protein
MQVVTVSSERPGVLWVWSIVVFLLKFCYLEDGIGTPRSTTMPT